MRKFSSVLVAFVILPVVLVMTDCGPSTNPSSGLGIYTSDCQGGPTSQYNVYVCHEGTQRPVPHVPVSGKLYGNPNPNSPGSVYDFGFAINGDPYVTTDQQGRSVVANAHVPDYWDLFVLWPFNTFDGQWGCGGTNYTGPVNYSGLTWYEYEYDNQLVQNYYPNKAPFDITCIHMGILLPASTRFAIMGSLPSTLTLGAYIPFTTQDGMPLLDVYDKTGSIVATEYASSVSNDGTQATFPFPAGLTQNGYSLAVENQTGSGPGFVPAGTNLLSIASSQTIQGNPFGVGAQAITTSWQSHDNDDPYGDGTCAGQWVYDSGSYTDPFPVVTQYALNQVSNGGTVIPVGSNPTAITLYDSQDSYDNEDDGPCHSYQSDTKRMTRAIVANSGSNTVSILDLVGNTVVSTITVGNQPVALAVSSDGSTAYVANYGDSTVTQVNLTTNTPATTIAVGGQPTSVALTTAGTLWVGGVGFLTEINTQNMSITATQSTNGTTIAALGFSNSLNELVATSMNGIGNVNIDEVNPSAVQPGTLYTTLASHAVSSLGTYFNPRTQTMVRGFTGTLSQSYVPVNTNQAGAPPLVVQDGWAVVSATPTGFSITDITGHTVLVSETTPSPIAAIAVDTNLNIAYLTMPDSNTLLTVPLPGTGGTN